MISWATYKRAALDYSRMRPREVVTTLTPVVGSRTLPLPNDALKIVAVGYGPEVSLLEALTNDTGTKGWASSDTELVLTPAPATTDPITVFYYARHLPDENTQTFPTIPVAHLPYVDDLELALILEAEADEMERGPLRYTIGHTEISREKSPALLRERAAALRKRVTDLLDEPVAVWR